MTDLQDLKSPLRQRAGNRCELCGSPDDTSPHRVKPFDADAAPDIPRCALLCATCLPQIDGAALDAKHWFCLSDKIWSEVPAVQVISWRLLKRLAGESWAGDLVDQAYLEDEIMAWAEAGLETAAERPSDAPSPTLDSGGTPLSDGDSVTLIRDLDVKGAGFTAKRGTLVKGISLTDNPEHVEGRVNKMTIVLKTCFLRKA